jgi:hypothetical protein
MQRVPTYGHPSSVPASSGLRRCRPPLAAFTIAHRFIARSVAEIG